MNLLKKHAKEQGQPKRLDYGPWSAFKRRNFLAQCGIFQRIGSSSRGPSWNLRCTEWNAATRIHFFRNKLHTMSHTGLIADVHLQSVYCIDARAQANGCVHGANELHAWDTSELCLFYVAPYHNHYFYYLSGDVCTWLFICQLHSCEWMRCHLVAVRKMYLRRDQPDRELRLMAIPN